jgi:hypothetical protein
MLPCYTIIHLAENSACHHFEVKTPPTNGDVIRQMSNEELVAFFITRDASYCVPDACLEDCEASKDCEDHWLRWLNAPAEIKAESEGEDE